jgi:DNA invertase Pin-like site-specific DNA recombinase
MKITRIAAQREHTKTRVAVYCRVSTDKDTQEDSLEIQEAAYRALIDLNPDLQLVGVYSDVISGMSAEKRPDFMRMVMDAMSGKIDRILCKSVSRSPATLRSVRSTRTC